MKRTLGYRVNILLFLLPALFLFVAVLIAPIAMSAYYSFMNWNGLKTPEFIGFKNYVELFTSNSISFVRALKNALLLAAFLWGEPITCRNLAGAAILVAGITLYVRP